MAKPFLLGTSTTFHTSLSALLTAGSGSRHVCFLVRRHFSPMPLSSLKARRTVVHAIPADLAADVDAKTGDGSITVNIPLTINGSLSHSSVHGKLNGGGQTLSISSGDGSIRLEKL